MEDQRSPTPTTTHCNETTELGCEINNITNLTNSKSLALEANLAMQNISPLAVYRENNNYQNITKDPNCLIISCAKKHKKEFPSRRLAGKVTPH